MSMNEQAKQACPEIPFFGARYPDAHCIDGYLWDMDRCDEDGNMYEGGDVPCPFCNTDEFIEYDPFSWVDSILEDMEEDGDAITLSMEKLAKQKARKAYIEWTNKMKERYGVVSSR